MKQPTRAAWKKHLLAYESILNVLMRQVELQDDDLFAVYRVQTLLRRQASEAPQRPESEG